MQTDPIPEKKFRTILFEDFDEEWDLHSLIDIEEEIPEEEGEWDEHNVFVNNN